MSAWTRSWEITRLSFGVIRKDKEMLWFPVLAGVFSLLFAIALIVPTFLVDVVRHALGPAAAPLQIAALFVSYFGLSFIATFFNVCTVYTTRVRLSGGDATFLDSIKFSLSKVHLIIGWSLVSASVGLLLRALDALAQRSGLVGKILISILRLILSMAWSIMTIFVVPAMVYRDLGPIDAVRDSMATLKKTWGESLIRYYGLGLAAFICMLPCFLAVAGGIALASAVPVAGLVVAALGVVAFLGVALVFGVATNVFNTVLYHYATSGSTPEGFDAALLAGAFRTRG